LAISSVRPRWEIDPPPSIERRRHLLAINDWMGDEPKEYGASSTPAPTLGAGLWIRRSAFLKAVPWEHPERLLPDRVGRRLASGGDIELGILIGMAGHRRSYVPTLRLVHEIPSRRFGTAYIHELITGIVRSELTISKKYSGAKFGLREQIIAGLQMIKAICLSPGLLIRGDVKQEFRFVMADRMARLRGPFRDDE
jgi:hypothetical protein